MENKVIRYDSDEAATLKTVTGWVSAAGNFFGDNEHIARYDGCTHRKCQNCENLTTKHWLICDDCRSKKRAKEYAEMEQVKWTGEPLALFCDERYFFHDSEILDYINDFPEGKKPKLDLVICNPVHAPFIEDYAADELAEDFTVTDCDPKLDELIDAVNQYIAKNKPILSWFHGNTKPTPESMPEAIRKHMLIE